MSLSTFDHRLSVYMKLHLQDSLPSRVYLISLIGWLALALHPASVQGQSVTRQLTGLTLDSTHHALAGASLRLTPLRDTTSARLAISDSAGRFIIKLTHGGTYRLVANHVGYESVRQLVNEGDTLVLLTFNPAPTKQLLTVNVSAKRDEFVLEADRIVVNVAGSALLSGGTALDVLAKTPRVVVDQASRLIRVDGKSGILLYVNNRQVFLTPDQFVKYLESLPASTISRIDVINSPSARYDASGGAVINIELKKSEEEGISGDISLSPGVGRYGKLNTSLGLNIRHRGWSSYVLYTPQLQSSYSSYLVTQLVDQPPLSGSINGYQFTRRDERQQGLRIGVDRVLTPFLTIGTNVFLFSQRELELPSSQTDYQLSGLSGGQNSIAASTRLEEKLSSVLANLNARYELKALNGRASVDADYAAYIDNTLVESQYQYRTEATPSTLATFFPLRVELRSLKGDFEAKTKSGIAFEAGLKVAQAQISTLPELLGSSPSFEALIPNLTTPFSYEEEVKAGYVSVSGARKILTWRVGLRVEHTNTQVRTNTLLIPRDYLNAFPTLSLQWKFPSKSQFSITANRRITRPEFTTLNPVYYFYDPFTIVLGNPRLLPQLSANLQVMYQRANRQSLTLGVVSTTNRIGEVVYRNDSLSAVLYNTQINFNEERRYFATISLPLQVTPFWKTQLTLTGQQVSFDIGSGENQFSLSQFSTTFNNINSFKLGAVWNGDVQFTGRTTAAFGYLYYAPLFATNLGIGRLLWGGKGSLKVAWSDIFHTNQVRNYGRYLDTDVSYRHTLETRKLFVTLTYHFGGSKVKDVTQRATALDAETRRLKGQ